MANQLKYTAVFEPAEGGGYIVTFPAIPDLATEGETLEEALVMAVDCLRLPRASHHPMTLPRGRLLKG
jgi:hypothetical protein